MHLWSISMLQGACPEATWEEGAWPSCCALQLKTLAAGAAPELLGMVRSNSQHCGSLSIVHRLWDCGTAAEPAMGVMPTSGLLLVSSSGFTGRFHHPVSVTRVIPAGFFGQPRLTSPRRGFSWGQPAYKVPVVCVCHFSTDY